MTITKKIEINEKEYALEHENNKNNVISSFLRRVSTGQSLSISDNLPINGNIGELGDPLTKIILFVSVKNITFKTL